MKQITENKSGWKCDICGDLSVDFEIGATRKKHIGGGKYSGLRLCPPHLEQWGITSKGEEE